ncbi:MAG TPA: prolyl oligopeptidase family serine peptidase [Acidobacteriaceae bacterium]|nr:prolyl oligopeptidase family serine peptidase [Acidobacteriaceae bacterium]
MECAVLAAVCLSSFPLLHAADGDRLPSNEDMRHVRSLNQPKLSPDGQSVLLQITDATADGGKTHLWVVDVRGGTARQLTYSSASDKRGESQGAWMPDGSAILFMAHRGEHTQLFRLPMNGGEAKAFEVRIVPPVDQSREPDAIPPAKKGAEAGAAAAKAEPIECDVERYFVAPDGKTIAILVRDPETPGEKKEHDDKADAVLVNHNPHGSRLYFLDPASGKITATAVPPDVGQVAWTRQSDQLLAITEGMNDGGDLAPAGKVWTLRLVDPQHPTQLRTMPATAGAAAWSPDASQIYFLAQSRADAPPGYEDLYEYTVASEAIRDLTDGFTGSLGHEEPLFDGNTLLEAAEQGMRSTELRFVDGRPEPLRFDRATVSQLNTNVKQTGWVWMGSSGDKPPAVYYAEKLGGAATALKTPDLLPATWTEITAQPVTWKNDGMTIDGLLTLPPGAAQHKVPLIVDVHGGPTGAFEDNWSALTEFLLGQGWAVLRTNPRGSTGYGAAFAAANKNDMGGADYRDIMAGVDAVIAKYPIDAGKMALMGYSYGGEMAGFVEGRTDRFKAIVSGAPVIDQESEYGTESGSFYDRWFYGGYPWQHPESAWRQSALADVAKAKTPFLLLQGESDRTDPLGQSEEMYRALRQMGVDVELVEYPREDHGPLAQGIFGSPSPEPWHGFDGRQRIVTFIKKAFGE